MGVATTAPLKLEVSFEVGSDLDISNVLAQNPRLAGELRRCRWT